MSLFVLASAKGAPGVTTAATALAHVWPASLDPILVELDAAGGDLTARLGLANGPGLATLAAQVHRSDGTIDATAHLQLAGGLRVLAAPAGLAAGRASGLLGRALGAALTQLGREHDLLVDAGRIDSGDRTAPAGTGLILDADLVLIFCRTSAGDFAHAVPAVAELHASGRPAALVPVGPERHVAVALRTLPVPVLGGLPDDQRGADGFGGAHVRPWLLERLPLVRAARELAVTIVSGGRENRTAIPEPDQRRSQPAPTVRSVR